MSLYGTATTQGREMSKIQM